jgi:hypothetical protein
MGRGVVAGSPIEDDPIGVVAVGERVVVAPSTRDGSAHETKARDITVIARTVLILILWPRHTF